MSAEVQQRWAEATTSVSLKKAVTYSSEEQTKVAQILSQVGSYPQKNDFTLTTAMSTKNYQMILNYLNGSSSESALQIVQTGFNNTKICVEGADLEMVPIETELDFSKDKYDWLN